ncbi:EAL domain-containing protein [Methylomarinum vadi]|uniref:EAL domain-containing protein n=1 Tax=Methylomarinum vadi TaxID=438855 RepID=UPI00068ECC43|nr:EAL domain-containing protein [Methylomarinum vadi]
MSNQNNTKPHAMKILLVDDETDTLEVMGRYLMRQKFETILTSNEEEALIQFDNNRPDVVVSDLCLGQGNGLSLYKRILAKNVDVPFILVSAYADKESLLQAFELGIDMVLPKPVRMHDLMKNISEVRKESAKIMRIEQQLHELSQLYSQSQHYLQHIENRARRLLTPIRDLSNNVKYFSKPAGSVSGDLFSEYNDSNGLHYLFLADSAGHGVDAAMPALFVPSRFTELARKKMAIQFIASELNEEIYKLKLNDFFVTITLVCFNRIQNKLQVINCGNPAALLIDQNGKLLAKFDSSEIPLGILPAVKFHPQVEEFDIKQLCNLYCYTDGLVDLENDHGKSLGQDYIEEQLSAINNQFRFDELLTQLSDGIERNKDDITMLDLALAPEAKYSELATPQFEKDEPTNILSEAKILFIQDEDKSKSVFSAYLKRRVGHLFYTHSHPEAVCLFNEFKPDLILLDIDLARPEGMALIKIFRKNSLTTPIVIFDLQENKIKQMSELLSYRIDSVINRQDKYNYVLDKLKNTLIENNSLQKQLLSGLAFQYSDNAMLITDGQMKILTVNEAFTDITGYAEVEVIGRTPRVLSSGRHGPGFYKRMWNSLIKQQQWSGEIWNRRKNGEIYLEWLSINAVKDEKGVMQYFIANFQDITLRKKKERRINFLAYNDSLTGLSNRSQFYERLSQWLLLAKRNQRLFAVLLIDLDHFKDVNDTLGHDSGDKLLQQVAKRMKHCLRKSDLVARLGGDEFAVLLAEPHTKSNVAEIAKKLANEIACPFQVDGNKLRISCSIGITCFPDDGDTLETLIKNADIAMYQAKKNGRANFEFFKLELNEQLRHKTEIRDSLFNATKNNELELHLQPKIDIGRNRLIGAEALIRWQHPQQGLLMPDDFIDIAEESGQIIPIGEWIIEETCCLLESLRDKGWQFPIAINVSPVQFLRDDFSKILAKKREEFAIPADLIEIEITESLLLHNQNSIIKQLNAIKNMRHKIAIDDFGIGYSSLSYLKRFPIDILKIDRSFMPSLIDETNENRTLTIAIIEMAKALGLDIIAEGVESQEQCRFLLEHGCSLAQGFIFSKALDYAAFIQYLEGQSSEDCPRDALH